MVLYEQHINAETQVELIPAKKNEFDERGGQEITIELTYPEPGDQPLVPPEVGAETPPPKEPDPLRAPAKPRARKSRAKKSTAKK